MGEDKIHEDEVEWLASVYCTSDDEGLKDEAFRKLAAFGLTGKQIKSIYKKTNQDKDPYKAFDKAWARQLERNSHEKYTCLEKIQIFFFGPIKLLPPHFEYELKGLWDGNYKIKFRQRLVLLVLGIIFWALFFIASYEYSERQWLQEIENTDISEWEKNRIVDE